MASKYQKKSEQLIRSTHELVEEGQVDEASRVSANVGTAVSYALMDVASAIRAHTKVTESGKAVTVEAAPAEGPE